MAIACRSSAQELDPWTVEHFNRAMQAQRANDLSTAEHEYRLITTRNSRFAGAYLNLGIVYHQQRKYIDAVNVLRTAVGLDPHMMGSQLFLGIDEYLTQDYKDARDHLRKAQLTDPKDRQAGLYLGFDFLALDQPFAAIEVLQQTAKYHSGDAELLYHLGRAHMQAAQLGIDRLNKLGDRSALSFWSLAIAAQQQKDTVGMLEDCMKALALDPYIAELYWEIANTLQGKMTEVSGAAMARYQLIVPDDRRTLQIKEDGPEGEIDEANQRSLSHLWRRIPEIHRNPTVPSVADTFVNQVVAKQQRMAGNIQLRAAVRLYGKGRYEEAAKELANVWASAAGWRLPYLASLSYERAGHHEEAEQIFVRRLTRYTAVPSVAFLAVRIESVMALKSLDEVLNAQPDSYIAKLLLGKYHAAQKQEDLALSEYQEALKRAPNQPGIHLAIAELYASRLKWASAIEEYRAELALDPASYVALAELGHALTEMHDANNAGLVLQQALRANPTNGTAYADLGRVWEMQGENEKAIQAYESALRHDPSQVNLHYKLSRLYQKQGQTERAQKELEVFRAGEAEQQKNDRKAMETLQNP